ncbi:hypothetical protein ABEF95_011433 [Exophiala dermatitidis]
MIVKTSILALLVAGSASAAALKHAGHGHVTVKQYSSQTRTETVILQDEADFGLCLPTMKYVTMKYDGGMGGRSATDFGFLPADSLCAEGQAAASNPNIITNRICDHLSTMCGANTAAQTLCRSAQAKIRALGTSDKSAADTWNTLLGFGDAAEPEAVSGSASAGTTTTTTTELHDLKRRDVPFVPCSASQWIDDCTGWTGTEQTQSEPSTDTQTGTDADTVAKRQLGGAAVAAAAGFPTDIPTEDVGETEADAGAINHKQREDTVSLISKRSFDDNEDDEVGDGTEGEDEDENEDEGEDGGEGEALEKRQVDFIECSATQWIDDCTGWA